MKGETAFHDGISTLGQAYLGAREHRLWKVPHVEELRRTNLSIPLRLTRVDAPKIDPNPSSGLGEVGTVQTDRSPPPAKLPSDLVNHDMAQRKVEVRSFGIDLPFFRVPHVSLLGFRQSLSNTLARGFAEPVGRPRV